MNGLVYAEKGGFDSRTDNLVPPPVNGVMVSGFDSPVSTGIDGSFLSPARTVC